MSFTTADLYDAHGPELQVVAPGFRHYGARRHFAGEIVSVKVFEDNGLLNRALESAGAGKVLVVDGEGSLRAALVGNQIAVLAARQAWEGIVVNGCVRDSVACAGISIGLMALATNPTQPAQKGHGEAGIAVAFGGVKFTPGEWLYADEDGIVVCKRRLI